MSQNHAISIDELWEETERLQARVAELQARLAQNETPETKPESEDVWDVWPYSWAQSGCNSAQAFLSHCFHSFHEKRLAMKNRQARREFWQTPHPENIEMKLV